MKKFMGEDFLLQSGLAVNLYNEVKDLPIIDYHCHLEPREIAENRKFKNITEMWLGGDHYKWRLMRAFGVDEKFVTGDADDYEKFVKWAETIDECIGSPLYHWTHLELKRYFDCGLLLNKDTAKQVWEQCNAVINSDGFTVWGILDKFNVESLCTTDDPADMLEHHKAVAEKIKTKVLPTLRPSAALNIEAPGFTEYIGKLARAAGTEIKGLGCLTAALRKRVEYFHEMGCRLSDHALDPPVFEEADEATVSAVFKKAMVGGKLTLTEINQYKTYLMVQLGRMYADKGWTMQLHVNAQRNNSGRMYKKLGADKGYDAIMSAPVSVPLSRFMDTLDADGKLPKTILYSLDPVNDDVLATLIGCFQDGSVRGKMQLGSAWWFNDTKTGMEKQMLALANNGLLSAFVGMLTDSRSFLSYTRHEYFRRIMVNMLANWAVCGEFPDDMGRLAKAAKDIAYYNAKGYFGF
jgi:glucuronate isomerase